MKRNKPYVRILCIHISEICSDMSLKIACISITQYVSFIQARSKGISWTLAIKMYHSYGISSVWSLVDTSAEIQQNLQVCESSPIRNAHVCFVQCLITIVTFIIIFMRKIINIIGVLATILKFYMYLLH